MSDTARIQNYRPWRASLLDTATLDRLNRLDPPRMMRDTLLLWAQIAAAWTVVGLWPHWWTALPAMPVIGARFYALFIIGHDGLHRRLFAQRDRNDLWNDLFALGPIGAITRLNRVNHMTHHDTLGLPHDPDRYKYLTADKLALPAFLFGLTGLRYLLRAIHNVFTARPNEAKQGYSPRDIAILVGWQLALIGGLTAFIGWWAWPVLWLLPIYLFTFTADLTRVFLEHSYLETDDAADHRPRLVSYVSNPIERRFFAPLNMNLHAAHHLWPSIPYYNLPEADRLMRQAASADSALEWRNSYLGYLFAFCAARAGLAAP